MASFKRRRRYPRPQQFHGSACAHSSAFDFNLFNLAGGCFCFCYLVHVSLVPGDSVSKANNLVATSWVGQPALWCWAQVCCWEVLPGG
ncbi:hypothetical protein BS78_02G019600 [Paspalum vaginatum]|nr:hypothetical protein BS78_02G019600 [Paspalum vaginatum]